MSPTVGAVSIVGAACRYPDAANPDELWHTVLACRRAFRPIPPERLDLEEYGGKADDPDATYLTRAGLIRDWEFDRVGYRVPGSVYRAADLTHWLALDMASEALRDAGFVDGNGLDRDRVGVLLGNSLTGEFSRATAMRVRWPFARRAVAAALEPLGLNPADRADALARAEHSYKDAFPEPGVETLAGALSNTIAGRVCNHFDFHGTGYTVDGACSSSLLAVAVACRAILSGELEVALAGGVDVSLDPFELVGFSRLSALAVGEMRVYDAEPTGFLPGEGCGVVVLMASDEARRRGLRRYADIVGWGSSSDGAGGLTRPAASGQAMALRRAYAMAGVEPAEVDLVEGHGTGTPIGDTVELSALSQVRGEGAPRAALGSIKANIGHTKAAAGVASLIKAALAVHHRILPPTTGVCEPHPLLRRDCTPLRVLDEPEPWPAGIALAAVSAMGFGGINAHVVLRGAESWPQAAGLPAAARRLAGAAPAYELLPVEAPDPVRLGYLLGQLADQAATMSDAELGDLATTLRRAATGRAAARACLVAGSAAELVRVARRAQAKAAAPGLHVDPLGDFSVGTGAPIRVGLMLPGQAAPVRASLGPLGRLIPPVPLPVGVAVADGVIETSVAQPAIVRQSLAGLAWLTEIGCAAIGAVGHSLGELVALSWAGALTPEVALELAVRRGAMMAEYGLADTTMASVGAGAEETQRLVSDLPAVLAGVNGPTQSTVAGPTEVIREVVRRASEAGLAARRLPVSHGFHGPAMEPVAEAFRRVLTDTAVGDPVGALCSTVTGDWLAPGEDLRALLVRQLTSPVLFAPALQALAERCDLLVEVGPGTMLSGLAAGVTDTPAVSLDCGGDPRMLATATAALVAGGVGSAMPWFTDRHTRILEPGHRPTFLVNPCSAGAGSRSGSPAAGRPAAPEPPRADRLDQAPAQPAPPATRPAEAPAAAAPDRPDDSTVDVLATLRAALAEALELPLDAVPAAANLLGDLRLNSLRVVQILNTVARQLGRAVPTEPLNVVDATVAETATLLSALPVAGPLAAAWQVAGAHDWVLPFTHHWVPADPTGDPPAPLPWEVDAPSEHPLHGALSGLPDPGAAGGIGLAVALAGGSHLGADAANRIAEMMHLASSRKWARLLIVHDGHPAAAAVGRSVCIEQPHTAVTVLDQAAAASLQDVAGLVTLSGYRELRRDTEGRTWRRVTRRHRRPAENGADPAEPSLRAGEVCLVTGGLAGITSAGAAQLAEATGATLVVLGRTPADSPAVVDSLAGLRVSLDAHYLQCDVTDATQVAAAVQAARRYGPVCGLVHGAGVNHPQRLAAVTAESLSATLGPKPWGLRTLLDACGDGLRVLLTYGSIIGRRGLAGESEYCVANDWMGVVVEQWAAAHPECRTHALEWSIWSGIGMGVSLGVVDDLQRQGVAAIAPAAGGRALRAVLTDSTAPVTVLLMGRCPPAPTLTIEASAPPLLRFAERVPALTPGAEAVIEADIGLATDPYLDDHRIDEIPIVPAVVGFEAIAQALAVAVGERATWSMRDLELRAPIAVTDHHSLTVRIAVAVDGDGERETVSATVRDADDGFGADRIRAVVETRAPSRPAARQFASSPHQWAADPFYGGLFFHRGRFRRVAGYDVVSAFRIQAWLAEAEATTAWFSAFHSGRLLLGDPAAHDATIHALLACVPHRGALPVGVDRLTIWAAPTGRLAILAVERKHTTEEFVFDVDLVEADGTPVAQWEGLRLRVAGTGGALADNAPVPLALLGPWLTRRMIELGFVDPVELVVAPGRRADGTAAALAGSIGAAPVEHNPQGRLVTPGESLSAAYAADHVLVGRSAARVGVDWEVVDLGHPPELDVAASDLATVAADKLDEPWEAAAFRIWTVREALRKCGHSAGSPLSMDDVTSDGLVVLRANNCTVVSALRDLAGTDSGPGSTAVAIAVTSR